MTNQGFSPRRAPRKRFRAMTEAQEKAKWDELVNSEGFRIAAQARAKELTRLEEVTPEWIAEMVTRVFNETRRQIEIVEKSTPTTAPEKTANARTLASLQHTLSETLRMRRECEAHNETKGSKKNADPKGKLARGIDRHAAEGNAGGASRKPD